MIKIFDATLRLFFFPVKWANAVTTWIQNVSSPDDSIKVRNTCSPKEGDSLKLTVNMNHIYDGVKSFFAGVFVTFDQLREHLDDACDHNSIEVNEGQFRVSEDWVKDLIESGDPTEHYKINGQTGSPAPADESYMPDDSETKPGGQEFDPLAATSKWDIGDTITVTEEGEEVEKKCGVKFRVYTRCKFDDDNYVRYLYFRELTFGADGKLTAVSKEKGLTQIGA